MTRGRSNKERPRSLYDLYENGTLSWSDLNRARDQELVARFGLEEDAPPLRRIPGLSESSLYQRCVTNQAEQQAALREGENERVENERMRQRGFYCANLRCKAYISTNCVFRDSVAYCLKCGKKTCAHCKETWDPQHVCVEEG